MAKGLEKWNPMNDQNIKGDPYKTIIVARLVDIRHDLFMIDMTITSHLMTAHRITGLPSATLEVSLKIVARYNL